MTKGTECETNNSFYADERALLYRRKEDAKEEVAELALHFKWFGMLMHAGTIKPNNKKTASKTVAVYFPTATPKHDDPVPSNIIFGDKYIPFLSPSNTSVQCYAEPSPMI